MNVFERVDDVLHKIIVGDDDYPHGKTPYLCDQHGYYGLYPSSPPSPKRIEPAASVEPAPTPASTPPETARPDRPRHVSGWGVTKQAASRPAPKPRSPAIPDLDDPAAIREYLAAAGNHWLDVTRRMEYLEAVIKSTKHLSDLHQSLNQIPPGSSTPVEEGRRRLLPPSDTESYIQELYQRQDKETAEASANQRPIEEIERVFEDVMDESTRRSRARIDYVLGITDTL